MIRLALLALVALAGCVDEPTMVRWEVHNQSSAPVAYTLIMEDGPWINGTAEAGQTQNQDVRVHGAQTVATARLRDDPGVEDSLSLTLGSCVRITAHWDGQWTLESSDCP